MRPVAAHGSFRSIFLRVVQWLTHPVVVFVGLQIVWIAFTVLWVIWFMDRHEEIANLARAIGSQNPDTTYNVAILTVGLVLLGILLVGTVLLFVFAQKQSHLIRQQRSFLSSVTHELRSPLASLQLTLETLREREVSRETNQKMLSMMASDTERLGRLVNQILVSARLDRGIMVFEPRDEIALREVITQVTENASYLDTGLARRLVIHCPDDVVLEAPRQALVLVLGNLLENAIKYSPLGTPIEIVAGVTEGMALISISDQGIGLEKKDRRRIFKMFHRSEIATKKAIPGTGLGLYIVRSAVQMLGGNVWAESRGRGRGSTFYVAIPVVTAGKD